MTAVLLAAGISSRLRPLTNSTPKSLLLVGGKPLLLRSLEALRKSGVQRCIIITGYLSEMIEDFIKNLGLGLEIHFVYNRDFASTNNNYSLWLARPMVETRRMLLLDADILFDQRIVARLNDSPHENALVMRSSNDLGREEIKVELDRSGRVLHIGKELDPTTCAGESVGIERFSVETTSKLFDVLERRKRNNEFYEASFQEVIDQGAKIYAVDSGELPCIEIDTPDDLAAAEQLVHRML